MGNLARSLCRVGLHRWRSSPDPADAYLRCTRCEPPRPESEAERLRRQLAGAVERIAELEADGSVRAAAGEGSELFQRVERVLR